MASIVLTAGKRGMRKTGIVTVPMDISSDSCDKLLENGKDKVTWGVQNKRLIWTSLILVKCTSWALIYRRYIQIHFYLRLKV